MMILLTGGSSCGKSGYAEDICVSLPGPRYYIASMRPWGETGLEKVRRHRRLRAGKGFETIERYTDLAGLELPERGTVLMECIATLTANEMYDEQGNMNDPVDRIVEGIRRLEEQAQTLVVITNDVGSEMNDYSESTNAYIRAIGKINAILAGEADSVCEMVCGIPLVLKGKLPLERD